MKSLPTGRRSETSQHGDDLSLVHCCFCFRGNKNSQFSREMTQICFYHYSRKKTQYCFDAFQVRKTGWIIVVGINIMMKLVCPLTSESGGKGLCFQFWSNLVFITNILKNILRIFFLKLENFSKILICSESTWIQWKIIETQRIWWLCVRWHDTELWKPNKGFYGCSGGSDWMVLGL